LVLNGSSVERFSLWQQHVYQNHGSVGTVEPLVLNVTVSEFFESVGQRKIFALLKHQLRPTMGDGRQKEYAA
jgi:hypothetical protein